MSKKVIGGILAGVAIVTSIAYAVFDYNTTVYRCGKCKTIHRPSVKAWLCGMHAPGGRLLKCPECGKTSWNKKFVLIDENDFI